MHTIQTVQANAVPELREAQNEATRSTGCADGDDFLVFRQHNDMHECCTAFTAILMCKLHQMIHIQSRMPFKIQEISKHASKQAPNKTSITPIPQPPIPIPSIKHQSPHLDTLPRLLVLLTLIHKRRMRHPARHPRLVNRVKALYQRHLIRPLGILEIPPMPLVRPDRKRLPAPVGVDEPDPDQIRLGDRVRVGDGERVFEDCFDGAPDL